MKKSLLPTPTADTFRAVIRSQVNPLIPFRSPFEPDFRTFADMSAFINSPIHTGTDLSVTLVLWEISRGWPRAAARVKQTTLSLSALLLETSHTHKQVVDLFSGRRKCNISNKEPSSQFLGGAGGAMTPSSPPQGPQSPKGGLWEGDGGLQPPILGHSCPRRGARRKVSAAHIADISDISHPCITLN